MNGKSIDLKISLNTLYICPIGSLEKTLDLFKEAGYNCSQAVVILFADLFPNEKENLLKIASPFGGGY